MSNQPCKKNTSSFYYNEAVNIEHIYSRNGQNNRSKLCWNCFGSIDTFEGVVRVPYDVCGDEYLFDGSYCSLGCAKRSIIDNWCHQASTRMLWLNDAATKVFGIKDAAHVPAAPPRQCLQDFGGPLTRKEFNSRIEHGKPTIVIQKPLMTFPMKILEERSSIEDASKQLSCLSLFEVHTNNISKESLEILTTETKKTKKKTATTKKTNNTKRSESVIPNPSQKPPVISAPQPPEPPKSCRKKTQQNSLFNYVLRDRSKK